jgi:hypothetical protein
VTTLRIKRRVYINQVDAVIRDVPELAQAVAADDNIGIHRGIVSSTLEGQK